MLLEYLQNTIKVLTKNIFKVKLSVTETSTALTNS